MLALRQRRHFLDEVEGVLSADLASHGVNAGESLEQ
jgi:hypothetical protein